MRVVMPCSVADPSPADRGVSASSIRSSATAWRGSSSGTDLAIATSGTYERGEHIVDARAGSAPRDLLSMTVIGPALGPADAFATAAFAMGRDGLHWLDAMPGYCGCAVTVDGQRIWTPGFDRYLV